MPRLAGVPLTIMPGALDVSIPSHRPCSLPGRLGFEVRRKSRGKRLIDYGVIICWSHQDEAFLVEVPELPGCMADGSTYKEAVDNAEVVIREWIRTAEELGRPIPQPEGRPIFA